MKWSTSVLLLLLLPVAFAYQHAYLVFTLDDSWKVADQRSMLQSFTKDQLYLEVRAEHGELSDPAKKASELPGGKVLSNAMFGPVNETVIIDAEHLYILASTPHGEETYVFLLIGKPGDVKTGKAEMQKIYKTISFSTERKIVEAPWEKQLPLPVRPPLSERVDIPWDWIVFYALLGLLVWFIGSRVYRRFSGNGKKK